MFITNQLYIETVFDTVFIQRKRMKIYGQSPPLSKRQRVVNVTHLVVHYEEASFSEDFIVFFMYSFLSPRISGHLGSWFDSSAHLYGWLEWPLTRLFTCSLNHWVSHMTGIVKYPP